MSSLSARPPYSRPPFHDQRSSEVGRTTARNHLGVRTDSAMQHQRREDLVPLVRNAFSGIPTYFANVRAPNETLTING